MVMSELLLSLVFTPILGIILSLIIYPLTKQMVKVFAVLSIAISAISSLIIFVLISMGSWDNTTWMFNNFIRFTGVSSLTLSISSEPLGIFMSTVASFLGLLIAIFSTEYMRGDKYEAKYWLFLQLFILGMNLLVLSTDLILLFVGWEIVGLCSFALISHYYYKNGEDGRKAGMAGVKAFVFTHIADAGFLVAIIILYSQTGSLLFSSLQENQLSGNILTVVVLSLFISAIGKSALLPFTPWLSSPKKVDVDAMQGPTTVSALIHAATMVKAGVYLLSRIYLIFPVSTDVVIWIIVLVPAISAITTAMSALVSNDIKRILAYSTVSQLSYMFMALVMAIIMYGDELSTQAFLSAQFHLISHAIFKSLLFLTAGYLIHQYHSRNITDLTGVAAWKSDKIAFLGIVFGSLSLSGIFPFVGFFSKEKIIGTSYEMAFHANNSFGRIIYIFSVITAIITAMYCGKLIYYLVLADMGDKMSSGPSYPMMQGIILLLSFLTLFSGLFVYLLPEYFSEYGEGSLGFGQGDELFFSILLLVILIIVLYLSIRSYSSTIHSRITSNIPMALLNDLSLQGFYIDALWKIVWNQIIKLSMVIRRLHTGNLNYTMFLVAIMSFSMTITILGG